jgi:hypothetical protein
MIFSMDSSKLFFGYKGIHYSHHGHPPFQEELRVLDLNNVALGTQKVLDYRTGSNFVGWLAPGIFVTSTPAGNSGISYDSNVQSWDISGALFPIRSNPYDWADIAKNSLGDINQTLLFIDYKNKINLFVKNGTNYPISKQENKILIRDFKGNFIKSIHVDSHVFAARVYNGKLQFINKNLELCTIN